MRRVQIIGALCLATVACLLGAVSASAAPSDPFQYKFSFGQGLADRYGNIVVNHETGNVLVADEAGKIHQFDADGNPLQFPATGSSEIQLQGPLMDTKGGLMMDNSGGITQGNFYLWDGVYLNTFDADGNRIGESATIGSSMGPGIYDPKAEGDFSEFANQSGGGAFLEPDGTLWATYVIYSPFSPCGPCETELVAITPEGDLTGEREYLSASKPNATFMSFPTPTPDGLGYLYVSAGAGGPVIRLDAADGFSSLGSIGLTMNLERVNMKQIAVDPATNDVYLSFDTAGNTGSVGFKGVVASARSGSTGSDTQTEVLSYTKGLRAAAGIAFDASGETLYVSEEGQVRVFHREAPSAPRGMGAPAGKEIRSRGAVLQANLIDGGAPTTFRFEYGLTTAYGGISEAFQVPRKYFDHPANGAVVGLEPGTTYHARMVATNSAGTTYGPDGVFRTYQASPGTDPCPNALARKQAAAQSLPDCRAYELASAADTGGYDVESYRTPGQAPFPGFPLATDRLLYAAHSGAIPGPWNATNKGPDPYVATRTANGWVTQYEGLPSNLNPSAGSFASVLGEADASLRTLAFAGPNLCDPCFTDGGLKTGIPVRMPSGQLVQGMSGSLAGSVDPSAKPEGKVAKYFSADGKKLLFASKYAFEPGANENGSDLTVYARDLAAGATEIVSTDPAGNVLTGEGISELDVSRDGSRVVIGKKLGSDSLGNELVHPYLHIAGRPGSIDLAPLASGGVLYAGMTSDGAKVFFTTPDKLIGSDTDTSADLYEADVDASGDLSLEAITASNSDSCAPVDCSAVPISGGGGVAAVTGAIYFLSPESFGGQGTLSQPNLYLAQPNGQISFVATLEPGNPLLLDSLQANAIRKTGDFQTTPSGNYAAFTSNLALSGLSTHGLRSVYRYSAGSAQLDCASCDLTGTTNQSVFADAELPPSGLALLEDGRLFLTTAAQLAVNDANAKKDVYEWTQGLTQLISAGSGPFDSGLLTVSADGTDVFFFTHDNLSPEEDRNGSVMRIYDAREGGGKFRLPASVPCQAADECHGPGTPQPGQADIKSSGKTTQGNVIVCAKNRVKKRGQCVKKKQAHAKKKHHNKKRKRAAKKRAAGSNGERGGRNA